MDFYASSEKIVDEIFIVIGNFKSKKGHCMWKDAAAFPISADGNSILPVIQAQILESLLFLCW